MPGTPMVTAPMDRTVLCIPEPPKPHPPGTDTLHDPSATAQSPDYAPTTRCATPNLATITVQGTEYELPQTSDEQLEASGRIAATYAMHFLPGSSTQYDEYMTELIGKLHTFRNQLSRTAAEERALADAQNFELDDERLSRDINRLRQVGSLNELIREHHHRQQKTGMNAERIRQWLGDDPDSGKILEICDPGVIADTDPNFRCTERSAPLRDLQRRLAPVYYKAAAGMHDTDKVLLFRVADLTMEERGQIHMANEYHWRPEPGKVAGRPLMDCSNAPPGAVPLNTETTKQRGIERYQRVKLPTFREVLTQWNRQRRDAGLTWEDMWMFKADITGCFNQIHWTPDVSKLMGFMLTSFVVMIMVTCGFGVTVTPMAWSVVGDALNRAVNKRAPQPVFTFVDDFFGSGTHTEATESQRVVHDTVNGVLGPEGISVKKNVFAQRAEILGILVDYTAGTIRPKDRAIEKMFYILFSIDTRAPQPLRYWQCISSILTLYAPTILGMQPFVAPITHMTHKAHRSRKTAATPNAQFALEVWRVVVVRALLNPQSCATPIGMYLQDTTDTRQYYIVSDASPWRLCAALYEPKTNALLGWATYRLPYARDVAARHQGHREYLGHLFSTILLIAYLGDRREAEDPVSYQWINDNNGALAWAKKHKCASLAGQYTCFALTQLHIHAKIHMVDPEHKPGAQMGDIDTMSRIPDGQHPVSAESQSMCPTLTPQCWWNIDEIPHLQSLFRLLDPTITHMNTSDYHAAYNDVHIIIRALLNTLTTDTACIRP